MNGYYQGENWYVILSNSTGSYRIDSSNAYANTTVLSGYYSYKVVVTGSSTAVASGQVKVNSQSVMVPLNSPARPVSKVDLYALAAVGLLIVISAAVLNRRRKR